MKTLYIVRHAKSSWKFPELSDFDRPLNKRGKRDAPEMGRRFAKKNIFPGLILSSPAKRAFKAAKAIAKAIDYPENKIKTDMDIYHASASSLLRILQSQNDSISSLMIFGHNPGFTSLANMLANDNVYNIPTTGVYVVEFDVDNWSLVAERSGRKIFFDFPKNLA